MTTLHNLIIGSSIAGMEWQNRQTGAMPGGHNGPYHDPHTPVRNTGHWLILFLKAHEISGEERFLKAADLALKFLCSREARPVGAAFHHRTNPEKDTCNGLIGQAWTFEALIRAGHYLHREEYLQLAETVFLLHPFNEEYGLWQRVAADGMQLSIDATFNHQLWFAAAAAPLAARSPDISRQITRFMDMLQVNLRLYSSGLIFHHLLFQFTRKQRIRDLKRMLMQRPGTRRAVRLKSLGYHQFNLFGFAMLHQQVPDHRFWQSGKFLKAVEYAQTGGFRTRLFQNPYGFPYNPPGFEMAFAMRQLEFGTEEDQISWVREQITRCYNMNTSLMDRNTEDPHTQAARLYEAVRLPDMEI